ncbi:hypothetical protein C0992_001322 [Termitomyces sp. T32_za158]|nr:hypothetical protein C0992_001322 [Termitomyces sp. T32_za158]
MATAMSTPLPHHYTATQSYPYVHRPAKYRFQDIPQTVSDETHRHPTNQVEADAWRSSPPKFTESGTGPQPDISIPPPSNHFLGQRASPHSDKPATFLNHLPRQSLRVSEPPITPTPPPRPTQPFIRNAESFGAMFIERPQSASSTASSVVSELGPARPGGEAARHDLALGLRERRFRELRKVNLNFNKPRTQGDASGTLLHLLCPACPAVYCRGCKKPVRCDRNCNARHNCDVKRCCSEVRALAIFEYLSAFDQFYLDATAAFHVISDDTILNDSQRREYLDYVLFHADQYSSHEDAHQFLSMLKRTVKAVYFWLLPEEDSNIVDCCVGPMLTVSFLPEVLYELIKQVCWQKKLRPPRLETIFQAIKKLLNTLAVRQDEDLTRVVYSPLSMIDGSRGLGAWLWDDDDTCTWSSFDLVGPSQILAEWIPFLDNFFHNAGIHVDRTSGSNSH